MVPLLHVNTTFPTPAELLALCLEIAEDVDPLVVEPVAHGVYEYSSRSSTLITRPDLDQSTLRCVVVLTPDYVRRFRTSIPFKSPLRFPPASFSSKLFMSQIQPSSRFPQFPSWDCSLGAQLWTAPRPFFNPIPKRDISPSLASPRLASSRLEDLRSQLYCYVFRIFRLVQT